MKNVPDKRNGKELITNCEGLEVMASVAVSQASEEDGCNLGLLSAFKSGVSRCNNNVVLMLKTYFCLLICRDLK